MQISQLFIYPIKSCAAVAVEQLVFDRFGPCGDRRFMVVDADGRFLTQRQCPDMAFIQPTYQCDPAGESAVLRLHAHGLQSLDVSVSEADRQLIRVTVWQDTLFAFDCGPEASHWFSQALGGNYRLVMLPEESCRQVSLKRAKPGRYVGFADGYPLLVCTQASIDFLSSIVGRSIDIERFRPNVVLSGNMEPFAELQWQRLEINSGYIDLVKPCERCVIPTRDLINQQREADVLAVLKQYCRVDGKILFGQNGIESGVTTLKAGELVRAV